MVTVCSCVCVCVFPGSAGESVGEAVTGGGELLICWFGDGEGLMDTGQADVQTCTPLQVSSEGQHAPLNITAPSEQPDVGVSVGLPPDGEATVGDATTGELGVGVTTVVSAAGIVAFAALGSRSSIDRSTSCSSTVTSRLNLSPKAASTRGGVSSKTLNRRFTSTTNTKHKAAKSKKGFFARNIVNSCISSRT